MITKALNGKWRVTCFPYNSSVQGLLASDFVPEGWLEADVPEEIHATLRRQGLIKGHYYGKDLEEERWIEESDWVYYRTFYVDASFQQPVVTLCLDGLDTFCEIYLNGALIGAGKNMHLGLQLDVREHLRYGERNVLLVRFLSPVKSVQGKDTSGLFSTTTLDRILVRKAQMNYSWDFCGRCVTTGIWKGVYLRARDHAAIESYYIYTRDIVHQTAHLGLEVTLTEDLPTDQGYSLSLEISFDGQTVLAASGKPEEFKDYPLTISAARLWWSRPYGEQALYDLRLTLLKGDQIVDHREQKLGIRTVEIIQEEQADGRSFIFSINGRRIFARGANWVPLNVVYTDIRSEDYDILLAYAAEGHISMLRVWGGGIYEDEHFYDLCDRYGILVMQDFMFACGVYPQDEEFCANVRAEAVYQLKRIRNYTCLLLWSGDNENDLAYGWDARPYGFFEDNINRGVLYQAWQELDPHRYYLPSSPTSPFSNEKGGDNPNSPYQGDMHQYLLFVDPAARDYYKKINTYRPRFVSEFGFVSLPEKETYFRFNFFKKDLDTYERIYKIFPTEKSYLKGGLDPHESMIYFTQVYNSQALKYWIEHFRSLKWTCAGCLYWKFDDPLADNNTGNLFPTLMAVIDFYHMPKMSYYYTRRAYEDVILALGEVSNGFEIYGVSELLEDLSGELSLSLLDFEGTLRWNKDLPVIIRADASSLLYTLNLKELVVKDPLNEYIQFEFHGGERSVKNHTFLVDIGEYSQLKFKPAGLYLSDLHRKGEELVVELQTHNFARHVRLNILDQKAVYADNYFDMPAGTVKRVRIRLTDSAQVEDKLLYIECENQPRIVKSLALRF